MIVLFRTPQWMRALSQSLGGTSQVVIISWDAVPVHNRSVLNGDSIPSPIELKVHRSLQGIRFAVDSGWQNALPVVKCPDAGAARCNLRCLSLFNVCALVALSAPIP